MRWILPEKPEFISPFDKKRVIVSSPQRNPSRATHTSPENVAPVEPPLPTPIKVEKRSRLTNELPIVFGLTVFGVIGIFIGYAFIQPKSSPPPTTIDIPKTPTEKPAATTTPTTKTPEANYYLAIMAPGERPLSSSGLSCNQSLEITVETFNKGSAAISQRLTVFEITDQKGENKQYCFIPNIP